jgi:4-amino-4-deoxy-L-arabinose transferase-like glycosyltransferase
MLRPAHLLRQERLASYLTEHPIRLTVAICAVWVFIGLVGHDPWKPDETHTFGVTYRMLTTGEWIVPMLAGEPFLEKPPLVYYSGALFAWLLSPLLEPHDAARMAAGAWIAVALLFTGFAARELFGGNRGWVAVLMLIGSGGLLVRGHLLISDVIVVAAFAIALHGFALAPRLPRPGGVWMGVGLGLATFASGLFEPLMLLTTAVAIAIVSPMYRTRSYVRSVLIALMVATPIAIAWPIALYLHSPELFAHWLRVENLVRIHGMVYPDGAGEYFYYLRVLPWFAWPVWLFALWSVWMEGRDGLRRREIQLPIVAFAVFFAYLTVAGEAREVLGLPLLLPLALLASLSFARLPRGGLNAYYWFCIMVATVFSLVVWVYWSAIEFGVPRQLAEHMQELQPAYEPARHPLTFALALLFTATWLLIVFNIKRTPERPVILWGAGVTTVWALVVLLLFAWIDTGKSYRGMVDDLKSAMHGREGCIYSQGLGETQRAMLDYHGQIVTHRLEAPGERPRCDLLVTQDNWNQTGVVGAPWNLIWEGGRPGDYNERYRLYGRLEM